LTKILEAVTWTGTQKFQHASYRIEYGASNTKVMGQFPGNTDTDKIYPESTVSHFG